MTRKRKLVLGFAAAAGLVAAGLGTWVSLNAAELRATWGARQVRTAAADDERAAAADRLVALGEPGLKKLVELVRSPDAPTRAASVAALDRYLGGLPDGDPRAVTVGGQLLDAFPALDATGQQAVLELVPVVLKKAGSAHVAKCRAVVATGLRMPEPATRVFTTRLAMHPDVQMRGELVPLLAAPEGEVRRAALFAVAAAEGEPLIGDEELFHYLHDPDDGVRKVCRDALVGRDRTETEIGLGRRLTDPDPLERLKLLLDLRYDDDVADPDPWLERLSRDPEPAVRAGAARVAIEVATERQLLVPVWLARVSETDSDGTVRRVARFFRKQAAARNDQQIKQVGAP
ncbi:hypothetical protein, partial : HEAT repeat protein OS=Singulisphaera acidiphila (strain ATCC BAA-1392 / DSM 18658 / VKM B-2454 / MOB10) GN=Sinac_1034 PE=4 SV=1 [Gemmataceae bacterium]